ncbi:hypothetical protein SAMN05421774_11255 [Gemmobacter megaterium]|uniref:Phage tail tape measure protein, lambda family n=1 Tax=Gemmobacter megaterium TaxID=1086013 RepID=A0A1N7QIN8_9RHOB|nr:hypothetical protein [Gemmobacter megaterium]GGE26593.1 hypothetical protein GCM10011345_35720 [Gemmobacter megaterium]SIT22743.1 hypothetical protein SAMN05421774_11255 [Gemmobacter megaterium]
MASLKERLRAFLGLDTTDFDRGLDRSGKRVKTFGQQAETSLSAAFSRMSGLATGFVGGLGAGLVTTALSSLNADLAGTVKGIAQLGDEAKRSGLGLRAFQEWKFVAEQNRIGVDQLVDGFKELSLRADEWIVTGGGAAAEAFTRLGYSASDLRSKLKDPSALMLEIIGRLGQLDKAAQIRVSDELFGGSAGERFVELLGQGESGLRSTIERAHQLGIVMDSELVAKANDLDRKFGEIGAKIDNFFKRMVVGAFEAAEDYSRLRREHGELFAQFERFTAFGAFGASMDLFGSAAGAFATETKNLADALSVELSEAMNTVRGQAEALESALIEDADALHLMKRGADAAQIRAYAREIGVLLAEFATTKNAQAFAEGLAEVNRKAVLAYDEIRNIDGIKLGGVIGQIGSLALALLNTIGIAQRLKDSLPGGPDTEDSKASQIAARGLEWSVDPSIPSNRPRRAPNDAWWEDPVGGKGKSKGGGKRDGFAAEVESTRARIAELEAEAIVLAAVASGNRQLGDAVEFARKKAQLLNAAKKEGREITPELAAEIDQLALSYMNAGLNADQAKDKLEEMREATERGIDSIVDMFDELMFRGGNAKKVIASLIAEIAKAQFRQALAGVAASGGGGILRLLGGLIGRNAHGTTNWAGGITMVGELGAELVSLPRGSQVYSALDTQRMLGNAGQASRTAVEVIPSPYFDVRVSEISGQGDMQMARAQQLAMPSMLQDMQARGLR